MTYEERLAAAEGRLAAFEKRYSSNGPLDHGLLQLAPGKRGFGSIDARIDQYKRLQASIAHWRQKVDAQRRRTEAPARREAKAQAHNAADLKAR
ncbi:TPA: hypothetical protein OQU49_004517, partial [Shigella flexneri]|nr:hypothetical protein [Shigella flexneri]